MAQAVTTHPATTQRTDTFAKALREAGYAPLIAFGLFVLLIGAEDRPEHPQRADPRPALGPAGHLRRGHAVGRFLFVAYAAPISRHRGARPHSATVPAVAASSPASSARTSIAIGASCCCSSSRRYRAGADRRFAGGLQGSLKWVDNFGIQILIYVMLAWGLNIVVGLAGLLDLGYVAFYAVGAYAYALLGTHFGLSFWILLPAAGLMAAFWGVMLGFPGAAAARRLSGDRHAGLRRDHPPGADQLARGDQRLGRHFRHPEGHLLRPVRFDVSAPNYIAKVLGIAALGRLLQDLPLLPHPGALPAHRLRDRSGCAACRSGVPGRRCARTRSPAARSASTPPHQAHGLCDRRDVRRLRRLVLRRTARLRQPRILRLPGIGDRAGDRGSRRHGFAGRHRGRGAGDDRRHRDPARADTS